MKQENVIEVIRQNFNKFTKTQRLIANYICNNVRYIPAMSVQEMAKDLNTSDASIIRFAQLLGYKGYLEMRSHLKHENINYYSPQSRFSRTLESNSQSSSFPSDDSMADVIARNDFECHKEFYETFDRTLVADATKQINMADTIYIAGFGTDSVVATFLHWYLQALGYKSICCKENDFTASKQISTIGESDLLILFSTPRHLTVEKSILYVAKDAGASTICISPDSSLELSSLFDLSITISDRSNELLNSYITYMSFCNMLIMSVYESNRENIDRQLRKNEKYESYFNLFM